jgi:hypothetical protein
MTVIVEKSKTLATELAARVDGANWSALVDEVHAYGCAQTPQILTPEECRSLSTLYDQPERFRSTITMARYRFGSGEYRYFKSPFPEPVEMLRQAFYPHLLTIARDWAGKLGRSAPWPDTLDAWLAMCHAAGQTRPTPILLRYQENDWNALHRDLYGDLVFPLQVVVGLSDPGVDHTGGEFLLVERHRDRAPAGPRLDLHDQRTSGRIRAWLVRLFRAPWRVGDPLRCPLHPRPGLSRRCVMNTQQKQYTLLGPDRRAYQSATPGLYGGNRRSKLYGRLDCAAALRAISRGGYVTYRVFFADEQTALRAGYRPCAVCLPRKYAVWKASRLSATAPSDIRETSSIHGSRYADRCRGPPGMR